MPASSCCTNCRTKYSMLNREAGCSNCALSFCKKCLGYRSIIPNLSDKPLTVCYDCYKKLESAKMKSDAVITSTPLPSNSQSKNWWGEGLPPPSFRQTYSNGQQNIKSAQPSLIRPNTVPIIQNVAPDEQIRQLEERRANLKDDIPEQSKPLSIEEIEKRLAALRECDVEVIRNPRSWFSSDEKNEMNGANTVEELMEIAKDRARLEEKDEELDRKDYEDLENRRRNLLKRKEEEIDNDQGNNDKAVRESVVSGASDFSMATQEQMNEINSLLENAEKTVAETKKQEECDAAELKKAMSITRQKSLDAMQWNQKITKEIGGFWERQCDKASCEDEKDEDEKSLDEETFKKILHEAENAADVPEPEQSKEVQRESSKSPKKRGFFDKLFRRDS